MGSLPDNWWQIGSDTDARGWRRTYHWRKLCRSVRTVRSVERLLRDARMSCAALSEKAMRACILLIIYDL